MQLEPRVHLNSLSGTCAILFGFTKAIKWTDLSSQELISIVEAEKL